MDATSPSRTLDAFATAKNKSVKPIVSQNFGESLNNRTPAVNDTQINRHLQSSAQVRQQSEKHAHYRILYA